MHWKMRHRVVICVFLVLNLEIASCQPSAPSDQQQQCIVTNVPSDPGHGLVGAYSDTQKPLLDSYWYERVFGGSNAVWTGIRENTGDTGWARGQIALCRSTMISRCNVGQVEDNWVSTQFISKATAQSPQYTLPIVVNISYQFLSCDCPRMFRLHYYQTNTASDAARQLISGYVLLGTLSDATSLTTTSLSFNLTAQNNGFYIGFQDQNSCATVGRLQVYRVVCPQRIAGMAVYPETPTGVMNIAVVSGCSANSALIVGSNLQCAPGGEWLGNAVCQCSPGYQNTSHTLCEECSVGTFKSTTSNSPCSACPANSMSSSTGATVCACVTGYYRASTDDPSDPCTTPPGSAPLQVTSSIVGDIAIGLMWNPPADTGGRSDLSYTVTYRTGNTTITMNVPNSRVTLVLLQPLTSYNVTVSAENGVSSQDTAGRANRTTLITVTTSESIIMFSSYVYTVATYLLAAMVISLVAVVVGLSFKIRAMKSEASY